MICNLELSKYIYCRFRDGIMETQNETRFASCQYQIQQERSVARKPNWHTIAVAGYA